MKIIIIGAVAAGTSAAAKARRNIDNATITVYEKDQFISYSGCGMPYFIGGEVDSVDTLTPRDPKFFKSKYNVDVKIGHEVIDIDEKKQTVTVKNLSTNEVFEDSYDKLILATGATPFKPELNGINESNVFFLRNIRDAIRINDYINVNKPKDAVIVGTGYIGSEMLESFVHLGINVTIVQRSNKIVPSLDQDMAKMLENKLLKKGIKIIKSTKIENITSTNVTLTNGETIPCDILLLSTGVKANVALAEKAGVAIGNLGGITVTDKMETNIQNIYACGDCIETFSSITNKPNYKPLGSTANKTGRIAGHNATGGEMKYRGNLGTGIFKLFEFTIATTGLSEKEAIENGFEIQVCHNIKPNRPEYMGAEEMTIKAVADKKTNKLLGVQIVGGQGVDKRIDVFATLLTYNATIDDLFHLDLAYAPPYSTTKDPVHYTGMILENAMLSNRPLITNDNISSLGEDVQIIDARTNSDFQNKGSVEGAINMPHSEIRKEMEKLDKNKATVTFCNKGTTGNAAQNILIGNGFEKVYNLSGGHKFYTDCKDCK